MEQVLTRHVSGRLKVAPEHTSDDTLHIMRKPSFKHFHEFKKRFDEIDRKNDLNQQLVPYFISSHPGSTEKDMADLAAETKDMGFQLEQVQGFTPTPMTVATVIYYAGVHPYTLKPVYTARSEQERDEQHRFFFWWKPENRTWIKKTLDSAGRPDLAEKLLEKKAPEKKSTTAKKKVSGPRVGKSRPGRSHGKGKGKKRR